MKKDKIKILFVCLGNICRSPAAQGVMQRLIEDDNSQDKVEIDSAGLYGGHAGQLPDRRMRVHAARRGLNLTHRSRRVETDDFEKFDFIIGMDANNLRQLRNLAPSPEAENKVKGMMEFARLHPYYDYVPDPYYEGAEGFELVLDLLEDACQGFYDYLVENKFL